MDGFAIGRYEDCDNNIAITHDGCTIMDELDTIVEEYKLSPDDIFNIIGKYGKWDKKAKDYNFDDFIKAAQAVEELEGRIVMEKLTGE